MKLHRRLFIGSGTVGFSSAMTSFAYASFPPGDIRRYGAVQGSDISAALHAAILDVQGTSGVVVVPSGVWRLSTSVSVELSGDLSILGELGAVIEFDHATLILSSNPFVTSTPVFAQRGVRELPVLGVADISAGQVLTCVSNDIAETSWNSKAATTTYVVGTDPLQNTVELSHPLNFQTSAGSQVFTYEPIEVQIQGLTIESLGLTPAVPRLIDLIGLSAVRLYNLSLESNGQPTHTIRLARCTNGDIQDCTIEGGTYPFLLQQCRDIYFERLEASNSRHVVTPAEWTDGVYVNDLVAMGCSGGVESHPAFNVHYSNVEVEDLAAYSNLRSVGGSIRNSTITSVGGGGSSGPYFQSLALVDPTIYRDYQFTMEGVFYDQAGAAMGPSNGGVFLAQSCHFTGGLRIGPNVDRAEIYDCSFPTFTQSGLISYTTDKKMADFTYNAQSGLYELDLASGDITFNDSSLVAHGTVYRGLIGDPSTISVKVFDAWLGAATRHIQGVLTLRAMVRHQNTGAFDVAEYRFHLYHKIVATSVIHFPSTPAHVSAATGQAGESLSVVAGTATQAGYSQTSTPDEHFFQVPLTILSGRTNPVHTMTYELKLAKVE